MSTNSLIAVQVGDKIHAVYCHWDGYLSHNGRKLQEHYNSQELAEELVSHGSISSLGDSCEKPEGHTYNTPVKGYTVYYGRDCGEDNTETQVYNSFREASWDHGMTHNYLFRDGNWYYGSYRSNELILLKDALKHVENE